MRAMRPLHWMKNILIFAPVVFAHGAGKEMLLRTAAAFAAFCLTASGTYLFNDLRDLEFDRLHATKRNRAIASGAVAPATALVFGALLVAAGLVLAGVSGWQVLVHLIAYGVLSAAYSLYFKRVVFLDVLALSALYAIRVLAGGAAAGVEVSDWLLALSVFLFVSLALLKRYGDLAGEDAPEKVPGRAYMKRDRDLVRTMGVASGYLSVLVLALYLTSPQVVLLYRSPRLLWLVCPLMLYWIAHMWFRAHRGAVRDDPIVVAATDPVSYAVGAMILMIAFAAV